MRAEFLNLQIPLPIAIVGLGLSGLAAQRLLLQYGVPADQILTFDPKVPADFQDPEELLKTGKPRSMCVSPGVPLQLAWIQEALGKGLVLTSELELAFAALTSETVIAITGSVGKSTTTSLLAAGALAVDPNSFSGGNLGIPLAEYCEKILLGSRSRAQYLILELSSYQLENFKNLKSSLSVLTYLSPNHLERYQSLHQYYETKLGLFERTSQVGILNQNGGDILKNLDAIRNKAPALSWVVTSRDDQAFQKQAIEQPKMVGSHNLDNLAMAFAVARHFHWSDQSFKAMLQFPGLPHRLENCGSFNEVLFLNDSKSTTMDSVLQAYRSVRDQFPNRKMTLLLGGKDKSLPWEQLSILKKDSNLSFQFFGEVGRLAQDKSSLQGSYHSTFALCLSHLAPLLSAQDIVLLSPGGTSWDEFKNFEERGNYFKNWILSEFQKDQA